MGVPYSQQCWADNAGRPCNQPSESNIGLCADHYKRIVGEKART